MTGRDPLPGARPAATPASAGSRAPVVPEGGSGSVDLQPDVERLHRAVRREPSDPVEGRESPPWFFVAAIAVVLFWGGWYLGRYGGEFGLATHVAFAGREPGITASANAQAAAAVSNPIEAGGRVYQKNCTACHQPTGKGIPGAFPPLVGSEWVTGAPETLVRILLHGLQGPVEVAGATYNGAMPAWKDVLKDEEIAALATYIRQLAPNAAAAVDADAVAAQRNAHADRAAAWTAAELRAAQPASAPQPPAPPRSGS